MNYIKKEELFDETSRNVTDLWIPHIVSQLTHNLRIVSPKFFAVKAIDTFAFLSEFNPDYHSSKTGASFNFLQIESTPG